MFELCLGHQRNSPAKGYFRLRLQTPTRGGGVRILSGAPKETQPELVQIRVPNTHDQLEITNLLLDKNTKLEWLKIAKIM